MKQTRHQDRKTTHPRIDPIHVDIATEIPADTSAVFAYLSNLEHNPMWNWAVTETRPLDGGPRRGSRYLQTRSSPRRSKEILEITGFSQDQSLEVTSDTDGAVICYRYGLTSVSAGKTRLELSVDYRPRSRVGRPDLLTARLADVLAINLENLRMAIIDGQVASGRSGAA